MCVVYKEDHIGEKEEVYEVKNKGGIIEALKAEGHKKDGVLLNFVFVCARYLTL